jgi:predicted RNA-binding Zn ribbon-like protein
VDLTSYGQLAVQLVNTTDPARDDVDSLVDRAGLLELTAAHPTWAARVADSDVAPLRALRGSLRTVFEAAAAGDTRAAATTLNGLLAASEVRPQVSDHDGGRWHLHMLEGAPSVSTAYAAAAVMGLAVLFTEVGPDRFGLCQAPPCRRVYVDTSTNRSRRYCSDRCATRANVAAYRARRRAGQPDRSGPDRSGPDRKRAGRGQ